MVRAPTHLHPRATSTELGFSLVELVVVIVITGVIASVVGLFITGPIQAFLDQSRRAALVDTAQMALIRMGRDLRGSLPNSIRTNGSNALELLATLDGDRYRVEAPGTAADRLEFALTGGDDSFNTLAPLDLPAGATSPVTAAVAIYPLQQSGADPYDVTDGVMTATGAIGISAVTNAAGQAEGRITLPAPHRFPFDSPARRVFLVDGPVTWLCSPPQLLRYDSYAMTAGMNVPPAGASTVIVENVQSCVFQYAPGTSQRNAVVSIALSLADPSVPDERIQLIRQIHVGNAP